MVSRILFAAVLCLSPAYTAAQTGTGPRRDIAAIHDVIEQYTKAVDTVDLNLLSQNLVSRARGLVHLSTGRGAWLRCHPAAGLSEHNGRHVLGTKS